MIGQLALLLALAAMPSPPEPGPTFCGIARPAASLDDEPPELLELIAESNQLVDGTVVRVNSATVPIHASATFVVHANAYLAWPPVLARPAELTFVANAAGIPKVGDRAFFAGHVQMVGEGIALMEDARFDPATHPHLASDVPLLADYAAARELYGHLACASLVVRGRVQSVKTLGAPATSRHSPVWAEAVVRIEESACGAHPAEVVVRFDQSEDVARHDEPKLYPEQAVVLLLDRDTVSGLGGDAYAISTPGALLEPGQWSLVKHLASTQIRLDLGRARAPPRPVAGTCERGTACGEVCCEAAARCCSSPMNGAPVCIPPPAGDAGAAFACPVQ